MDLLPSSSMPAGVPSVAGVRGAETTRAHSRAAVWLPFVTAGELVKEPDGAIVVLKVSEKRLTDIRVGDWYRIWIICIPRVQIWAKLGLSVEVDSTPLPLGA